MIVRVGFVADKKTPEQVFLLVHELAAVSITPPTLVTPRLKHFTNY